MNKSFSELLGYASSGELATVLVGWLDRISWSADRLLNEGEGEVCRGRMTAFIFAITKPLVFLRDKEGLKLTPEVFLAHLALNRARELCASAKPDSCLNLVCKSLASYLDGLPKNAMDADKAHEPIARAIVLVVRRFSGESIGIGTTKAHYVGAVERIASNAETASRADWLGSGSFSESTQSAADLHDSISLESSDRRAALFVGGHGSRVIGRAHGVKAVATGLYSMAETYEEVSAAVVLSSCSFARTFGDYSFALAGGHNSRCATEGRNAHAVSIDPIGGIAQVRGAGSIAMGFGMEAKVCAEHGSAIALAHWGKRDDGSKGLLGVKSSMVGANGVEAGHWYGLNEAGEFVQVEPPRPCELDEFWKSRK